MRDIPAVISVISFPAERTGEDKPDLCFETASFRFVVRRPTSSLNGFHQPILMPLNEYLQLHEDLRELAMGAIASLFQSFDAFSRGDLHAALRHERGVRMCESVMTITDENRHTEISTGVPVVGKEVA